MRPVPVLQKLFRHRQRHVPFVSGAHFATQPKKKEIIKPPSPDPSPGAVTLDPFVRCQAISYYDDYYGRIYGGEDYAKIRPALLTPPQYLALPNPFTKEGEMLGDKLKELGAHAISQKYWGEETELEISRADEHVGKFFTESGRINRKLPFNSKYYTLFEELEDYKIKYCHGNKEEKSHLNISWTGGGLDPHIFDVGSNQKFPKSPIHAATGTSSYLYVNGGSIAPILALQLSPTDALLDICAGPGTKTLMAFTAAKVTFLLANDLHQNRVERALLLFRHYLGADAPAPHSTALDGATFPLSYSGTFNKILVDAPCSNDRESCRVLGNNFFRDERRAERAGLLGVQAGILKRSCALLKPGKDSAIVYSSCSLSPSENDGVVISALKQHEEESGEKLAVDLRELKRLLGRLASMYELRATKVGVLIRPVVGRNFGPMFVSRIKKF